MSVVLAGSSKNDLVCAKTKVCSDLGHNLYGRVEDQETSQTLGYLGSLRYLVLSVAASYLSLMAGEWPNC